MGKSDIDWKRVMDCCTEATRRWYAGLGEDDRQVDPNERREWIADTAARLYAEGYTRPADQADGG